MNFEVLLVKKEKFEITKLWHNHHKKRLGSTVEGVQMQGKVLKFHEYEQIIFEFWNSDSNTYFCRKIQSNPFNWTNILQARILNIQENYDSRK